MSTFGYTTIGGSTSQFSSTTNFFACKATLSESAQVTSVSLYAKGPTSTGALNVVVDIYADNSGSPNGGTLLATSNAISVPQNAAATWYTANLVSNVNLSSGTYWLCVHNATSSIIGSAWYYDATGTRYYNGSAVTYGSEPNPGTFNSGPQTLTASLYATYTPTTVPTNDTAPVASGSTDVGSVLSTTNGTWTDNGSPTFTYQWQRDNSGGGTYSDIASATSSSYTLVSADLGCNVRCAVTDTDTGGATTANSNAIGTVGKPLNTAGPVVSVTATLLAVTNGTWSDSPTSYSYQWSSRAGNISGATSATYAATSSDYGQPITCTVTATNANGSSSATATNYATPTASGYSWLRPTPPLLAATASWEQSACQEPTVLYDATADLFKMWYSGGWTSQGMGYATCPGSSDPTVSGNWTKYASNPVLGQGGSGFAGRVGANNIFVDAGTYYCYFYQGSSSNLYVSTSTDGIAWNTPTTAIAANQVAWSTGWANSYTWKEGSTFKMLVEGVSSGRWQIAYATSSDGLTFTVQGTGFLTSLAVGGTSTSSGPWLGFSGAQIGGLYYLWYHHDGGSGYATSVRNAYSSDAQTWTQIGEQIIPEGYIGGGATEQAADPSLVEHNGSTYIFWDDVNNTAHTSAINVAKFPGTLTEFLALAGGASSGFRFGFR